jgi:hypothetical protein
MRLAGILARTLDPAEREAVLGDLVESGETGAEALRAVLGLVARRKAALWAASWKDWHVWLAVALVFPAVHLLGRTALNAWLIQNYRYFDPALLAEKGLSIPRAIGEIVCNWALISACVVLAAASRRKASF